MFSQKQTQNFFFLVAGSVFSMISSIIILRKQTLIFHYFIVTDKVTVY